MLNLKIEKPLILEICKVKYGISFWGSDFIIEDDIIKLQSINVTMDSLGKITHDWQYEISFDEFVTLTKKWLFDVMNEMFDIRYHTNSNPRRISILRYGKDNNYFCGDTEVEALVKFAQYVFDRENTQC